VEQDCCAGHDLCLAAHDAFGATQVQGLDTRMGAMDSRIKSVAAASVAAAKQQQENQQQKQQHQQQLGAGLLDAALEQPQESRYDLDSWNF
jgi:hypothetical protein